MYQFKIYHGIWYYLGANSIPKAISLDEDCPSLFINSMVAVFVVDCDQSMDIIIAFIACMLNITS